MPKLDNLRIKDVTLTADVTFTPEEAKALGFNLEDNQRLRLLLEAPNVEDAEILGNETPEDRRDERKLSELRDREWQDAAE